MLKAGAALLIINSHLESFYTPSYLAADGLLGNTIFFFTTGFTLAGSLAHRPGQSMQEFLWKRISRLYPTMWIVVLLLPTHAVPWTDARGVFQAFVYTTHYSFMAIVLPLYPLFFLVHRFSASRNRDGILGWLLVSLATIWAMRIDWIGGLPGVAWSQLGGPLSLHFFAAMLLGGNLQRQMELSASSMRMKRPFLKLAGLGLTYGLFRALAVPVFAARAGWLADYAAMGSIVATLLICIAFIKLVDNAKHPGWRSGPVVGVTVFLAMHTWETYLLHTGVAKLPWVVNLGGGWGVLAIFAITLLLAPLLRYASVLAVSQFQKLKHSD